MGNQKLTASEKLKIQRKKHYDSLSEAQKKKHDKILYEAFMKNTAEAQKNRGYKTRSDDKATPINTKKAVQLKSKAVKKKKK